MKIFKKPKIIEQEEYKIEQIQATKLYIESIIAMEKKTIIAIATSMYSQKKINNDDIRDIKSSYKSIIDAEAALLEAKLLIQTVNVGIKNIKDDILQTSNYINIFELDIFTNRRDFLLKLSKKITSKKLDKEINHLEKKIIKISKRLKEFNQNNSFISTDISSHLLSYTTALCK